MTERKDRLIQTRVPEILETTLKEEARRQRTTVSQIIRNLLEDAFQLVDGVVTNVDQLVSDSVELAQQVGRDARRLRDAAVEPDADAEPDALDETDAPEPPESDAGAPRAEDACGAPLAGAAERLARVDAWNAVVLNRAVPCTRCGVELARGQEAWMGVGPEAAGTWLCGRAVAALSDED